MKTSFLLLLIVAVFTITGCTGTPQASSSVKSSISNDTAKIDTHSKLRHFFL